MGIGLSVARLQNSSLSVLDLYHADVAAADLSPVVLK